MRPKVDVICTFEYEQPSYVMVVDESCPVASVVDDNKCFDGNDPVNIDVASVQNCLAVNPKSDSGWWRQGKCLTDIVKAAEASRLVAGSMTVGHYNQIRLRLQIVLGRSAYDSSLSKLYQRMGDDLKVAPSR